MIEPEQVKDGSVQVVDVHGVLDGLVPELVGLPVGDRRRSARGRTGRKACRR